jgi:hypothetical protein
MTRLFRRVAIPCLAMFWTFVALAIDTRDTRLLSNPAISAQSIAFIYDGGLWIANRDGTGARRLTTRAILERQSLPRMEAHYGAIDPQALHNLMGVLPEYIETYINEVTRDHGSLDAYLETILGVDGPRKERLRARFVA